MPPAGEDTRPHGAPRCRAGLHALRVKDAWAENLGCRSTWSHACHSPLSGGRRQPRGLSRGCSPCNSGFLFPSPAPCGAGMPPSPIPSSSPAPPPTQRPRCFPPERGEAFIWELNPPETWGRGDYGRPGEMGPVFGLLRQGGGHPAPSVVHQ